MSEALKNSLKNKVTLVIFGLFGALILICALISFSIYEGTTKTNKFFFNDVISSTYYEVNDQYLINSRLNKLVNSKDYSLKNAYIELNPYKLSPLSGVIIFQTGLEEQIRVYVNDEYVTTMEASKKHIIPVYGLLEDYENIVKVESSVESQEYVFKTEKSNIDKPIDIITNKQVTDNLYFVSSSDKKQLTGWDNQGRLRFYLIDNNAMDIEWLPNNHFLIGTTQGEENDEYLAFVEMDYLGKIYNYYTTKYGVSHEMQVLANGNIVIQGGNTPIRYDHQMIYTLDPRNGNIIRELDIYDIIKSIDTDFDDKYLGSNSYASGFYLDEETNDLVVASSDGNYIWCFDYNEKKLNYGLTNPNNPLFKSDVWVNFVINGDSGIYPVSPNGVQITKGNIYYLNGNHDNKNYSNVKKIVIDKDNKTGYVDNTYKVDNKVTSVKDGSVRVFEDGTSIISYGTAMNNSKAYSKVVELNNNKEVVFDANIETKAFRIYKNELYANETTNIKLTQLKQYNSIPRSDLDESSYKKIDLDNSIKWTNSVEFTANSFRSNYSFNDNDKVELLLVNRAGKIFILNNALNRVFNISLPVGEYALFIRVNDVLYNSNRIYKF